MQKTSETIVFFGSGPVAAESLERLGRNFSIEAVVTKPKPPHHRGETPVLDVAKRLNIPIFTAENKASLDKLFEAKPFRSRLGVLIDFGIIVSQNVIDYFPLGIINSHFSLLPEWRGADPITFAVLSGQKQTGVSLMLLVEAMDEGPLLAQAAHKLSDKVTTPQLTKDLIKLSDKLLARTVPSYISGQAKPYAQDKEIPATYSRRLSKEDGVLDWSKSAEELEREVRAFAGWPGSRTSLAGKDIIITDSNVVNISGYPGQVIVEDKNLVICTKHNALEIKSLRPAGKNQMTTEAFLAGYRQHLER